MIIHCPACNLAYNVQGFAEGTQVQCRCTQLLTIPAHVVTTVRCPSCAGTVDAASERCPYCQSLLSRRSCPRCRAALREEAKFCDKCGEALRALSGAEARASSHACPRCRVPLFHQVCAGYAVESCAQCLGLWISHEILDHIYRDAPAKLEVSPEAPGATSAAGASGSPVGVAYVPCPDCGKIMNRINYERRSGIIIDSCREHGTWFDAEELNAILSFNAEGGVDEARRRERERVAIDEEGQRFGRRMQKAQDSVRSSVRSPSLFGHSVQGFLLR